MEELKGIAGVFFIFFLIIVPSRLYYPGPRTLLLVILSGNLSTVEPKNCILSGIKF
jgi:hypothetical protein